MVDRLSDAGREADAWKRPLSFHEMCQRHGVEEEMRQLERRLVFGYYPEVVDNPGNELGFLRLWEGVFRIKDVLDWGSYQKPHHLIKLAQVLGRRIGLMISYSELGRTCGIDPKTVEKYISRLEQSGVVFRLGSLSRNMQHELSRSRKVFCHDQGVRNILAHNFQMFDQRVDTDELWQNFCLAERRKSLQAKGIEVNSWFWRTTQQSEVGLVEEKDGALSAFDFCYDPERKLPKPRAFLAAYPQSSYQVISRENIAEFLLV